MHHFSGHGRTLDNGTFRRQIAFKHRNAAFLGNRPLDGVDDFFVLNLCSGNIFADGLAGDRQTICMQETEFGDFCHDRSDAARFIKLFNIVMARRCKMTEIRRTAADLIGDGQIEFDAAFMRNCRQMQHGIRRTSERHIDGQSILKGFARHDIARLQVPSHEFHNL